MGEPLARYLNTSALYHTFAIHPVPGLMASRLVHDYCTRPLLGLLGLIEGA